MGGAQKQRKVHGFSIESVDSATSELPPEYSSELFELLRDERRRVTEAISILSYVVFHDTALREIATYFPTSKESFERMRGIGRAKVEKYADAFCRSSVITARNMASQKYLRDFENRTN